MAHQAKGMGSRLLHQLAGLGSNSHASNASESNGSLAGQKPPTPSKSGLFGKSNTGNKAASPAQSGHPSMSQSGSIGANLSGYDGRSALTGTQDSYNSLGGSNQQNDSSMMNSVRSHLPFADHRGQAYQGSPQQLHQSPSDYQQQLLLQQQQQQQQHNYGQSASSAPYNNSMDYANDTSNSMAHNRTDASFAGNTQQQALSQEQATSNAANYRQNWPNAQDSSNQDPSSMSSLQYGQQSNQNQSYPQQYDQGMLPSTQGDSQSYRQNQQFPQSSNSQQPTSTGQQNMQGYAQQRPQGYGQQQMQNYGQRPSQDQDRQQTMQSAYDQQLPPSQQSYGQHQQPLHQNQGYGQQSSQAYSQSSAQEYSQQPSQSYGQPSAQGYGQQSALGYGQQTGQGYGQASAESYGHQQQPHSFQQQDTSYTQQSLPTQPGMQSSLQTYSQQQYAQPTPSEAGKGHADQSGQDSNNMYSQGANSSQVAQSLSQREDGVAGDRTIESITSLRGGGYPQPASNEVAGKSSSAPGRMNPIEIGKMSRTYYVELLQYFRTQTTKISLLTQSRTNAREKLSRLSKQQFAELSTDVHDELKRRQAAADGDNSMPYLPGRDEFHPKRNQARQKLATLPKNRFRDLASDVFFELERRFPEFPAELRHEPLEDIMAPKEGDAPASSQMEMPQDRSAGAAGTQSQLAPSSAAVNSASAGNPSTTGPVPSSAPTSGSALTSTTPLTPQPQLFVPTRSTAVEESVNLAYTIPSKSDAQETREVTDPTALATDAAIEARAAALQARSADEMRELRGIYEDRIHALEQQLGSSTNVREQLEQQLAVSVQMREQQVREAQQSREALERQLATAVQVHEQQSREAQQSRSSLEEQFQNLQRIQSENEQRIRDLEQELVSTQRARTDLENQLQSLRATQAELEALLGQTTQARDQYRGLAQEQQTLRQTLETRVRGLEQALEANRQEFEQLRSSHDQRQLELGEQKRAVQKANDELDHRHTELEALRAEYSLLHVAHANAKREAAQVDEAGWKREIERMQRDTQQQQQFVQELRTEVASLLEELRRLSARNDAMTADKESDVAIIRDLHTQMSSYKRQYENAQAALRTQSNSVQPFWAQASRSEEFMHFSEQGAIADTNLTSFQSAIDELLATARGPTPSNVLVAMKGVVLSTSLITDDVAKYEAQTSSDRAIALSRTQQEDLYSLKGSMSEALANLMNACRNHASSQGLSPVSLVDAAATHVSMAIIEMIKLVKLRKVDGTEHSAPHSAESDAPNSGLRPLHTSMRSAVASPPGSAGLPSTRTRRLPSQGSLRGIGYMNDRSEKDFEALQIRDVSASQPSADNSALSSGQLQENFERPRQSSVGIPKYSPVRYAASRTQDKTPLSVDTRSSAEPPTPTSKSGLQNELSSGLRALATHRPDEVSSQHSPGTAEAQSFSPRSNFDARQSQSSVNSMTTSLQNQQSPASQQNSVSFAQDAALNVPHTSSQAAGPGTSSQSGSTHTSPTLPMSASFASRSPSTASVQGFSGIQQASPTSTHSTLPQSHQPPNKSPLGMQYNELAANQGKPASMQGSPVTSTGLPEVSMPNSSNKVTQRSEASPNMSSYGNENFPSVGSNRDLGSSGITGAGVAGAGVAGLGAGTAALHGPPAPSSPQVDDSSLGTPGTQSQQRQSHQMTLPSSDSSSNATGREGGNLVYREAAVLPPSNNLLSTQSTQERPVPPTPSNNEFNARTTLSQTPSSSELNSSKGTYSYDTPQPTMTNQHGLNAPQSEPRNLAEMPIPEESNPEPTYPNFSDRVGDEELLDRNQGEGFIEQIPSSTQPEPQQQSSMQSPSMNQSNFSSAWPSNQQRNDSTTGSERKLPSLPTTNDSVPPSSGSAFSMSSLNAENSAPITSRSTSSEHAKPTDRLASDTVDANENWAELRNYIEVQTEAIVHSIQSLLSALREGVQGPQLNENLTQITTIVFSIVAISRDHLPPSTSPRQAPISAEAERIFTELTDNCNRLSDMQSDSSFDRNTKSVMASASYGVAKGLKALNELLNDADEAALHP